MAPAGGVLSWNVKTVPPGKRSAGTVVLAPHAITRLAVCGHLPGTVIYTPKLASPPTPGPHTLLTVTLPPWAAAPGDIPRLTPNASTTADTSFGSLIAPPPPSTPPALLDALAPGGLDGSSLANIPRYLRAVNYSSIYSQVEFRASPASSR